MLRSLALVLSGLGNHGICNDERGITSLVTEEMVFLIAVWELGCELGGQSWSVVGSGGVVQRKGGTEVI